MGRLFAREAWQFVEMVVVYWKNARPLLTDGRGLHLQNAALGTGSPYFLAQQAPPSQEPLAEDLKSATLVAPASLVGTCTTPLPLGAE